MKVCSFKHTLLLLFLISYVGLTQAKEIVPEDASFSIWLKKDFSPEEKLFKQIRSSLITGEEVAVTGKLNIPFDPEVSWCGITLFQAGERPLRYLSKRNSLEATINRTISKLRERERFNQFHLKDSKRTRILLEVVTEETAVEFDDVTANKFSPNRFEPGITGMKLKHKDGSVIFYMPTDATVYSHLSLTHALNYIAKKTYIGKKTNKISKRIELLEKEPYRYFIIKSVSFISYEDSIIPLYRGYPVPIDDSDDNILRTTRKSVDWIMGNMGKDGKFLYYYDGVRDTVVDHAHPTRSENNLYYNSLRHSGGTITLLRMYELSKEIKYLVAAKKSLQFIIDNLRERQLQGEKAYYLYYNEKAKLGGTGVALVALMRYYMATGDDRYNETMAGMARHLVSQIDDNGEFIGYYIHRDYNGGKPIINPSDAIKKQLFSFYYPGEALMGLALYTREMQLPEHEEDAIKKASMKAMDWLVKTRPVKYPNFFKPLPSDGWLMQAIEEWSLDSDFFKKPYLDFVFNDARKMIDHMYNKDNSPYYDYPGAFFYNYGDHAYVDGARAEGLISAYYLALRLGKKEEANYIYSNMQAVVRSLFFTHSSSRSSYMYRYPEKGVGTFRFKLTRQWIRVDSVQHTACFLIRLLLAPPHG